MDTKGGIVPSHASSGCEDVVLEGVGEALFRALSLVSRNATKKGKSYSATRVHHPRVASEATVDSPPTQYGYFKSHR